MHINWNNRRFINAGSSGVVYEIDGYAVKVGVIERKEYQRQVYFADHNKAIPVYYYERWKPIPEDIARDLCFIHGKRNDFYGDGGCECFEHQADVLVIALATPVEETIETQRLANELNLLALETFGNGRDTRVVNMGYYNGNIVGLDWG